MVFAGKPTIFENMLDQGVEKPLTQILMKSKYLNEDMIRQILLRNDLNHLLYNDAELLMDQIAKEFP